MQDVEDPASSPSSILVPITISSASSSYLPMESPIESSNKKENEAESSSSSPADCSPSSLTSNSKFARVITTGWRRGQPTAYKNLPGTTDAGPYMNSFSTFLPASKSRTNRQKCKVHLPKEQVTISGDSEWPVPSQIDSSVHPKKGNDLSLEDNDLLIPNRILVIHKPTATTVSPSIRMSGGGGGGDEASVASVATTMTTLSGPASILDDCSSLLIQVVNHSTENEETPQVDMNTTLKQGPPPAVAAAEAAALSLEKNSTLSVGDEAVALHQERIGLFSEPIVPNPVVASCYATTKVNQPMSSSSSSSSLTSRRGGQHHEGSVMKMVTHHHHPAILPSCPRAGLVNGTGWQWHSTHHGDSLPTPLR